MSHLVDASNTRLASRRVELRSENGFHVRRDPADMFLEALYRTIQSNPLIDPVVKSGIHDRRVKSFTLSPLFLVCADGVDRPVGEIGGAPPDARLWIRWTALDAITFEVMDRLFAVDHVKSSFRVGEERIEVVRCGPMHPSHGRGVDSYAELFEHAVPATMVTLTFSSPFAFRRGREIVRPTEFAVRHFFGGFLEKWSHFSPGEMDGLTSDALNDAIHLSPLSDVVRVRRSWLPSKMPNLAYRGNVRFRLNGDEWILKRIAALADYAWYCGTGTGTAWGMGQTERC